MNRIREYSSFAACFAGLGYVVLWPVSSSGFDGKPFGASFLCHDQSSGILGALCNFAHPLTLPPALHALGFLCAMFVTLRLLYCAIGRSRRVTATPTVDISALLARLPGGHPPLPRRSPPRPLPTVKPRAHFGLRGAQEAR
jgi:hypothetical protein